MNIVELGMLTITNKEEAYMLLTIAVILAVLWLFGFFVIHLGSLIHLILIVAIIVFVYNLMAGRRRA